MSTSERIYKMLVTILDHKHTHALNTTQCLGICVDRVGESTKDLPPIDARLIHPTLISLG